MVLLAQKHQSGELSPLGAPQYRSVSGEAESSYAFLRWECADGTIVVKFINAKDSFRPEVLTRDGRLTPGLQNALVSKADFQVQEGGAVSRMVAKADIEAGIDRIVNIARLAQPKPASD